MRYSHLVLDVDSTLSGIEGIDWLAGRVGSDASARIAEMTAAAMRGDIPLESVYAERLACVRPGRAEISALADAYIAAIAPGARETITLLMSYGLRVMLVSGGLRDAILPLAAYVGVASSDVHAVSLCFTDTGDYRGYDTTSPLWRSGGKPAVVRSIAPAIGVYFDLGEFEEYARKNQAPNTPALSLYYALERQLRDIVTEGMEARWSRHRKLAQLTHDWADEMRGKHGVDLSILAPAASRSPTVTALVLPPGLTSDMVVSKVLQLGFTVGTGYGKLKASTMRIGHMGDHTVRGVTRCLAACSEALVTLNAADAAH
jgi:phosphoserine phosphatase